MLSYRTRRGENAPNSRLTAAMRDYIKAARTAGATYEQIAAELGVSEITVRRADQRQTYWDEDW
jgi:IS30 family transposase